ncbi:MAG TPA: acyl-CoA dehydrogenase family protein, partial [Gemmatimonadota bacterium]|nr:acyl-CoA dehydrogenase family protein [Gemmatimonadota bacterium]
VVRSDSMSDTMPTTRGLNFYLADPNLEFVCSTLMDPATLDRARPELVELGRLAGDELESLAVDADRNPPVLRAWSPAGERIDEVVRHPAYRAMERLAFSRFGLAAMSHREGVLGWPGLVPHVVKYALSYLFAESEFGLLCPVNVTDSTSRMLRHYGSEDLRERYLSRLTSTEFETLWQGTQWMTEKTGGSDVGAVTTVARRDGDGTWRLWGDKWFCSNANTDVALTLARPEGAPAGTKGLAMFLVPRLLPDGTKNAWTINRLKDKLGSRSMATGEVTYAGAVAYVVGDPARGFHQMMEMVNVSRLSNAMRAAAIMRRCLLEAVVHARGRVAYGQPLAALPLLREDLLDMLLDAEGAASAVLHAAAVLDRWDGGDAAARPLFRTLTPLLKCWTTARARVVAGQAMNVRGGNGYVEDWPNARLLRDSFLGAIWEGSTNVVALDVQRALMREGGLDALGPFIAARVDAVTEPHAKPTVDTVRAVLDDVTLQVHGWAALAPHDRERAARPVAETLYHAVVTSLLLGEGEVLRERSGDGRKLLIGALYARKWLRRDTSLLPWSVLERLDALIDWTPVPMGALTALG